MKLKDFDTDVHQYFVGVSFEYKRKKLVGKTDTIQFKDISFKERSGDTQLNGTASLPVTVLKAETRDVFNDEVANKFFHAYTIFVNVSVEIYGVNNPRTNNFDVTDLEIVDTTSYNVEDSITIK